MIALSIHTVFVLRENILFLEEWMDYHLASGFEKIYLYDNSNSIGNGESTNEKNKYNYNFKDITRHISEDELNHQLSALLKKFGTHVIYSKWEPKDSDGRIIYGQQESIVSYFNNYTHESDWTAFIDIDEFIYSREPLREVIAEYDRCGVGDIMILQKKFDDRFNNIGIPVIQITDCIEGIDTLGWGAKHIIKNICFEIKKKDYWNIHSLPTENCTRIITNLQDLRFNHYNVNEIQLRWMKDFYQSPIDFVVKAKCYDILNKVLQYNA